MCMCCRTQVANIPATQHHPIIMCPGLGSSGAYSFDLSPNGKLLTWSPASTLARLLSGSDGTGFAFVIEVPAFGWCTGSRSAYYEACMAVQGCLITMARWCPRQW
jgi:hypothetical protein